MGKRSGDCRQVGMRKMAFLRQRYGDRDQRNILSDSVEYFRSY